MPAQTPPEAGQEWNRRLTQHFTEAMERERRERKPWRRRWRWFRYWRLRGRG